MPIALEKCVASLQAKWAKNPKDRPSPKDPKQDAKSQAFAICTASLKKKGALDDKQYYVALTEQGDGDIAGRVAMLTDLGFEEDEAIELALKAREAGKGKLEGLGPVITGVALTIKPFIKRQERASIIDVDGRQVMRIPTMRRGAWRHPIYGILRFDDDFFSSATKNFSENAYGQDVPVKDGHQPRHQHALGWLYDVQLEGDKRDQFVLYANPTDDRGIDIIQNRKVPYASAEFMFNYKDAELKTLSLEGLEEAAELEEGVYDFSEDELACIEELAACEDCLEEKLEMADKDNIKETVQLSSEAWEEIQARLTKIDEMDTTIKQLSEELEARDEQIYELQNVNESALVSALVQNAKNYKDKEGKGHSAIFLNAYEQGLILGEIAVGDEVFVALSDEITPEAVRDYYRGVLRFLAENLPGVVPLDEHTEPDEERELGGADLPEDYGSDLWEA